MKWHAVFAIVIAATCITVARVSADVNVVPVFTHKEPKQLIAVPPLRFVEFGLGNMEVGDLVMVDIDVLNDVYKDLSVYLVDAANIPLVRQNVLFQGQGVTKRNAPLQLQLEVASPGPQYLVLDNRFANFVEKRVVFTLEIAGRLPPSKARAMQSSLQQAYSRLRQLFEFKDFNINVKPCGQSNAYSESATGDVTICTEILDEMSNRAGAMQAVILHELGHTLMNLWGLPNYANEDDADQFATVMLLRQSDTGKQSLYEWMQWYSEHDSVAQARNMLARGDTHSLSIQRIRNIQGVMQKADEFVRRWNNVLYPRMTADALKAVIEKPASFDNMELARQELAKK